MRNFKFTSTQVGLFNKGITDVYSIDLFTFDGNRAHPGAPFSHFGNLLASFFMLDRIFSEDRI